jgi:hypothetical protein
MRRKIATCIALLALTASACTSSADAEFDAPLAGASAPTPVSPQEAQAARMITNFFRALQDRNHYALYALFTPDDECRPARIEALLAEVEPGFAVTSKIEVSQVTLRTVGTTYSASFTLIENQGADQRELSYDEFFPMQDADARWRFAADLCGWLVDPEGGEAMRRELEKAVASLQAFHAEHGTYQATGNDLRYFASGLRITLDEAALIPGDVLLVPEDARALLLGQGIAGGWFCVAIAAGAEPAYGSGPDYESIAVFESCLIEAAAGGW